MNLAIIGYGKMGKMIEKAALEKGHKITAIIDPLLTDPATLLGTEIYNSVEKAGNLNNADAAIEFTTPGTAVENIKALAKIKMPMVIGTTGWHDQLDEVTKAVDAAGTSLIWSSNFSMGVNVFYRVAWYATKLLDSFPEFDIGGFETHHNSKLDSPSGTAKTLVNGVLARSKRKKKAVWEKLDRKPEPDELHFSSLRVGSVPGTHSLFFDSPADTIEITHTARNRESLVAGAIRAAVWLADSSGGKRQGVFTIDDMLKDILDI
ncbi:MAG TPA: 4-hydroxy-tetrahydrodipicolinate reductase [Treponema sp.]|nr:4-hydroxy-tetrahydrodipicolinate reductase [Treponema sp.]